MQRIVIPEPKPVVDRAIAAFADDVVFVDGSNPMTSSLQFVGVDGFAGELRVGAAYSRKGVYSDDNLFFTAEAGFGFYVGGSDNVANLQADRFALGTSVNVSLKSGRAISWGGAGGAFSNNCYVIGTNDGMVLRATNGMTLDSTVATSGALTTPQVNINHPSYSELLWRVNSAPKYSLYVGSPTAPLQLYEFATMQNVLTVSGSGIITPQISFGTSAASPSVYNYFNSGIRVQNSTGGPGVVSANQIVTPNQLCWALSDDSANQIWWYNGVNLAGQYGVTVVRGQGNLGLGQLYTGLIDANTGAKLGTYTLATRPSASSNPGLVISIDDTAVTARQRFSLQQSNGVSWDWVADRTSLTGLKWAALGTSITFDTQNSYVPELERLSGMVATNLAVSGASLSSTSSYGASGFVSQVAAIPLDSDIVTIECGANDFRGNATLGSLGDTTLSTFYGALYKTITDAQNQDWNRAVVVLGMYPSTPGDTYTAANYRTANGNGNYYFQFEKAVREVCEWLNVPYLPASMVGGPTGALWLADGIHLSDSGSRRYAASTYPRLSPLKPMKPVWDLRTAVIGDFSGDRLTPTSIDGSGVVQYTGQPTSGTLWAALWLTDGSTNNACEFEVADPLKGLWVLFGRGTSPSVAWIGKGDPGFEVGQFNYIAVFSALGSLFPATTAPVTNNTGVYATKYRMARIGPYVTCQALVSGKWLQAFNIDLDQQTRPDITSASYPQARCGILVANTSYTNVKNVRVGTLKYEVAT